MKGLAVLVFTLLLTTSVYAGEGAVCTMGHKGDAAEVLMSASSELETSNPDLAAKVKTIAADCCVHNLHDVVA